MRTAVVTIAVDETVLVAWELLERSGSRHLPIVHPDGRCAGLLDRVDVAVACAAPTASLSGLRVDELLPAHRPALVHTAQTVRHAADIVAALAGRPVREQSAGTRPQAPATVLHGLPPRRGYRGTAVP
ncbi:CBS domain-containing protein [Streptomyces coriariae]|uniref:CBS domain-containing protein n=1 Tax=Streptomyces coriariae TaxID=2864460 RepID=UPI001E61B559|nr:CBS domain-containing protein [Streptomyces coriariae]